MKLSFVGVGKWLRRLWLPHDFDPDDIWISYEPPGVSTHAPTFGSTVKSGKCQRCSRSMSCRYDGCFVPHGPFMFRRLRASGYSEWTRVTDAKLGLPQ